MVEAAAHRNMMGFYSWIHRHMDGARVIESDDELVVVSAHPFPFFSQAMRAHERDDGTALLERAREALGDRGFMLVTRPGLDAQLERTAAARGLQLSLARYPEMVCERPAPQPSVADGFELREVSDEETAREYWHMSSAAYVSLGCPPDLFDDFPPSLLLEPKIDAVVAARADGEIVAGALAGHVNGNGYVGWVGTVESARRRGLAAAVTSWATNRAFERGAGLVTLEASEMGEPIYPRLGFRELYSYRLYISPPR